MNRIVNVGEKVIGKEQQIYESNAETDTNTKKLYHTDPWVDALHFSFDAVKYGAQNSLYQLLKTLNYKNLLHQHFVILNAIA